MGVQGDLVKKINKRIAKGIADVAPFRAVVVATSNGLVQIQRLNAATADIQLYARTGRFKLLAGDVVLCVPLGQQPVIIDKIQNAALVTNTLDAGLVGEIFNLGVFRQPTSDNPSNASTSTWLSTVSGTFTCPAGTWTVVPQFVGRMTHSASGNVDLRAVVGGSASATFTLAAASLTPGSLMTHSTSISVVSDGSTAISWEIDFRANTAGTVTPNGSICWLVIRRTA